MNDRPKRERKPTNFFQYRDNSAASTIADVSAPSSRRKLIAETQATSKIKKEDVEPLDKGAYGGRGRSRGRGRGCVARDRGGSRSSSIGRSRRRSATQDENDQAVDELAGVFSDPIPDAGALLNDDDDPSFETNGNHTSNPSADRAQRNSNVPSGRKLLPAESLVNRPQTDGDEVIEQWYADPYERVNPDGIAYDQWRLQNIQTSLQNQGYSIVNSKQIGAWLMRCNGHFKEFDAPVRKSRAKKPRQSTTEPNDGTLHDTVVPDMDTQQDYDAEDNGMSDHNEEESEQAPKQSEAAANFSAFKTAISPGRLGFEPSSQKIVSSSPEKTGSITHPGSTERKTTTSDGNGIDKDEVDIDADQEDEDILETGPKKNTKLSDKYELENLKRCLNVFNAIYGTQGPKGNPARFELNHFSQVSALPILKPKAGLRTQAHYALQETQLPADNLVFFNGTQDLKLHSQDQSTHHDLTKKFRTILTEDPYFGLTHVPMSERATEADMKLYYAQFANANKVSQGKFSSIRDLDTYGDEGMTEEERRSLIATQNNEDAKLICEQLEQKVFDWETRFTMQGNVPKSSKDDKMRDGAFSFAERHVWKEIRRRKEILEAGGEEAARLLEQEYEDAQLEKRRDERRRQNAQLKAKKRAAWEAEIDEKNGRGKRVKFSEWVAEG